MNPPGSLNMLRIRIYVNKYIIFYVNTYTNFKIRIHTHNKSMTWINRLLFLVSFFRFFRQKSWKLPLILTQNTTFFRLFVFFSNKINRSRWDLFKKCTFVPTLHFLVSLFMVKLFRLFGRKISGKSWIHYIFWGVISDS